MFTSLKRRRVGAALAGAALLVGIGGLAGCSSSSSDASASAAASAAPVKTVRLGFFPNLTHAPALIGLQKGLFKEALSEQEVTVTPTAFNAGPDAVSALFGGSLDISYVGPNPTINAYAQSGGDAIKVISGSTSGGAALVVKPDIKSAADLKDKKLATPQLGNTQDVALRFWLKEQGYTTNTDGGGDVSILPQSNSEGLTAFQSGQIDGAWVPEPWVASYEEAGGKVLVDEKTLWPEGKFVTTNIVVRTQFLDEHPDIVKSVLEGHLAALDEIKKDPQTAQEDANASLQSLTGSSLDPKILAAAWSQMEFTADPLEKTLVESASHAVDVGLLDQTQLDAAGGLPGSLYDLTLVNELLKKAGDKEVSS